MTKLEEPTAEELERIIRHSCQIFGVGRNTAKIETMMYKKLCSDSGLGFPSGIVMHVVTPTVITLTKIFNPDNTISACFHFGTRLAYSVKNLDEQALQEYSGVNGDLPYPYAYEGQFEVNPDKDYERDPLFLVKISEVIDGNIMTMTAREGRHYDKAVRIAGDLVFKAKLQNPLRNIKATIHLQEYPEIVVAEASINMRESKLRPILEVNPGWERFTPLGRFPYAPELTNNVDVKL